MIQGVRMIFERNKISWLLALFDDSAFTSMPQSVNQL